MDESPAAVPRHLGHRALLVIAMLCVAPVLLMLTSQYVDTRGNVVAQCSYQFDPPGVADIEIPLLTASTTAFPAGRQCVYAAATGGTIEVQTGWAVSALGTAASVGVVLLTGLMFTRQRINHPLIALVPLAVTIIAWGVMILNAQTVTV